VRKKKGEGPNVKTRWGIKCQLPETGGSPRQANSGGKGGKDGRGEVVKKELEWKKKGGSTRNPTGSKIFARKKEGSGVSCIGQLKVGHHKKLEPQWL